MVYFYVYQKNKNKVNEITKYRWSFELRSPKFSLSPTASRQDIFAIT